MFKRQPNCVRSRCARQGGIVDSRHAAEAHRAAGFTLIELLATLTVMIILSTLAAASLTSTVGNNRGFTAQSEFAASLALARSEAMRRGVPVAVTASAPVATNQFGGGWTVWVDLDANGAFDVGEPVLRSHEALPAGSVKIAGTATTITYGPLGFLTPAGAVTIEVCPKSESRKGYTIVIQPNGLADVDPALVCP